MVIRSGNWTGWLEKLPMKIWKAWLGRASAALRAATVNWRSGSRWCGTTVFKPAMSVVSAIALVIPGGIYTCCRSRIGCVLAVLKDFGWLCTASGVIVLKPCWWNEARTTAGSEGRESTFCSLEKMLQMKQALNDIQSTKLTAWLAAFPNRTRVAILQIWRCNTIVTWNWVSSLNAVWRRRRFVSVVRPVHFLWTRFVFIRLRPAPVSSRLCVGVRVWQWTPKRCEACKWALNKMRRPSS